MSVKKFSVIFKYFITCKQSFVCAELVHRPCHIKVLIFLQDFIRFNSEYVEMFSSSVSNIIFFFLV